MLNVARIAATTLKTVTSTTAQNLATLTVPPVAQGALVAVQIYRQQAQDLASQGGGGSAGQPGPTGGEGGLNLAATSGTTSPEPASETRSSRDVPTPVESARRAANV